MYNTFLGWLKSSKYPKMDSISGDLARDILRDKDFPNTSDEKALCQYIHWKLLSSGLDPAFLKHFKIIFKSYSRFINNNN